MTHCAARYRSARTRLGRSNTESGPKTSGFRWSPSECSGSPELRPYMRRRRSGMSAWGESGAFCIPRPFRTPCPLGCIADWLCRYDTLRICSTPHSDRREVKGLAQPGSVRENIVPTHSSVRSNNKRIEEPPDQGPAPSSFSCSSHAPFSLLVGQANAPAAQRYFTWFRPLRTMRAGRFGSRLRAFSEKQPASPNRFAEPDYSDEMIGERRMRPLQLIRGHVTGHALLLPDRTHPGHLLSDTAELCIRAVAGGAFRIIESRVMFQISRRIWTGRAADTSIAQVVAPAFRQAVGLEAYAVPSQLPALAAHGLPH